MKFSSYGRGSVDARYRGLALVSLLLIFLPAAWAFQERPHIYALENVKIVVSPDHIIENGNIVIRDGLIEAAGEGVDIPPEAERLAPEGEEKWTVYAGFIDAASHLALKEPKKDKEEGGDKDQKKDPGTGNDIAIIHPEKSVVDMLNPGAKNVAKHRELGFGIAHVLPKKGLLRGTSAIVILRGGDLRHQLLNAAFAQSLAFETSNGYPNSRMGSVAAARQYFYDVSWRQDWRERYAQHPSGMRRPPLVAGDQAFYRVLSGEMPLLLEARDNRSYTRFADLIAEFSLTNIMILATGDEWRDLESVKKLEPRLCYPLATPKKPSVDKEENIDTLSMASMQDYLAAPRVPKMLSDAGIAFAFTTAAMDKPEDLLPNLKKVVDAGLSESQALAALTTVPARWLGLSRIAGTVEPGKLANLVVVQDSLFAAKLKLKYVFVDGIYDKIEKDKKAAKKDGKKGLMGAWSVSMEAQGQTQYMTWTFTGEPGSYGGYYELDDQRADFITVSLDGDDLVVVAPTPIGEVTIIGTFEDGLIEAEASVNNEQGSFSITFSATRPDRRVQGGQ